MVATLVRELLLLLPLHVQPPLLLVWRQGATSL
jgi:hypothetical protein